MTLGVVLGLCSAFVWGSGDYCGGRAATRSDPFQVLLLAAVSGIAMLAAAAWITGESLVVDLSLLWAAGAGIAGSLGIVALYRGLAIGSAATVAPLAAVGAAAMPVVYGAVAQGMPRPTQIAGFIVALAGIGLVARAKTEAAGSRESIQLGALAGIGFGGFLILIANAHPGAVYLPLAVARSMMLVTAVATLAVRRVPFPGLASNPVGLLAGVLDAAGNVLYLMAGQHVRLDIAAVLSSLYPVATVALARLVSREAITPTQWVGAGACLVAVLLITA